MANRLCVVVENDGETAVLVPFECDRLALDCRRAYMQRRVGGTPREFLEQYELMDGAAEVKTQMLDTLGITQKEMNEAMQRARSDNAKYQNLRRLVLVCRKERR